MNKATKRTVNYLRKYVGHVIIRTKETTVIADFSYTDSPIILKGFTEEGELIIQYAEGTLERRSLGSEERILPLRFTDRNWKLYSRVRRVQDSELKKWVGKKIRRTTPTKIKGDHSHT